jgi:hypothetical protein
MSRTEPSVAARNHLPSNEPARLRGSDIPHVRGAKAKRKGGKK